MCPVLLISMEDIAFSEHKELMTRAGDGKDGVAGEGLGGKEERETMAGLKNN